MMFMGGTGHALSKYLLTCGIGIRLGTSSLVTLMSCTSPCVFCYISRNFAFGGRSIALFMNRGSMPRLMYGLIKATQLPRKMRERMRQMCVCCVVRSAHHHSLW